MSNIFDSVSGICYFSFLMLILNPAFTPDSIQWAERLLSVNVDWMSASLLPPLSSQYRQALEHAAKFTITKVCLPCRPGGPIVRVQKCSASSPQFSLDKLTTANELHDLGRLDLAESEARTGYLLHDQGQDVHKLCLGLGPG